jgi:PEP-CTERM motif
MRNLHFCLVVALLTLLGAQAQANLLDDPSFEAAASGTQTSNSNWVLDTTSHVAAGGGFERSAQFQHASWASNPAAAVDTGVWFRSFVGDPAAIFAQADLRQSVVAPANGEYDLSFYAKREENFSAEDWRTSFSSTGTGGSVSIDMLTSVPADGAWRQYFLSLSGVTAGDTLTVRTSMVDGVDALANPQSAFVDDFDLSFVVPEPGSLYLACIGLLGLARHRR